MALVKGETKKPKTVLRTLRISSSLDDALASKASRNKVGKNALIVSVLSKYLEWDSAAEDLGYMTVPYQMIAELLSIVGKDTIVSVAKQVGKSVASSVPVWFGSADLENLLKYMEISVKYSGARVKQRIEREGSLIRIITYQPYNENGEAWARAFNISLVENVLGYPPRIVTPANSIETIIDSKHGM